MSNKCAPTALQIMIKSWTIAAIVPCGLISIIFLIWATTVFVKDIDIKNNGARSFATVINKKIEGSKEKDYLIEYEFFEKNIRYSHSSSVEHKLYQNIQKGDKVEIIFSSDNPNKNRMIDQNFGNIPKSFFYYLIIMMPTLFILCIYMIIIAYKKARIYRIGTRTKGVIKDIYHSTTIRGKYRNDKKYNIVFSFYDESGKQHENTLKHESEIHARRIEKNQELTIIYDPKNPQKCTIPLMDGIKI